MYFYTYKYFYVIVFRRFRMRSCVVFKTTLFTTCTELCQPVPTVKPRHSFARPRARSFGDDDDAVVTGISVDVLIVFNKTITTAGLLPGAGPRAGMQGATVTAVNNKGNEIICNIYML